jgi:rSAM/selenodomain-associated transferase 2
MASDTWQMRISIIIPVLNEESALPATLHNLQPQLTDTDEVIVVDGGSSDSTTSIAKEYSQVRLLECEPGRGQQMNAGAVAASGEWLLFLHADTVLPAKALTAISDLAADPQVDWGCFRHQFSEPTPLLNLISVLHNWRFTQTKVIYGDQAMFIKHKLFTKLGGFPEERMEDIKFSEEVRQCSTPIMLNHTVITDSRKFKQRGIGRSFLDVLIIQLCHRFKQQIPSCSKTFFSNIR